MKNETTDLATRIALRPVEMPADEEFLVELYYSTRDDISQAPIDDEQKKTLSLMQYLAQKQHYLTYYPDSSHDIILFDGERVGRLWTDRLETEIIVVDISLLSEYRNLGIGTFLLKKIFDEAEQTKRILNLHVLQTNTGAIRLWERLNFKFIDSEAPTHFKMRWRPDYKIIAGE